MQKIAKNSLSGHHRTTLLAAEIGSVVRHPN